MSRTSDLKSSNAEPENDRKLWDKPAIRRLNLTEEEIAALRQSDDPAALLRKLWPKIKERDPG